MRRADWLAVAGAVLTLASGAAIAGADAPAPENEPKAIAPGADSPGLWCFRPSRREAEATYERALLDGVDPTSLRDFHDRVASEPHVAGTEGDMRQIEYLRSAFEGMGLETEVQWIDVYLAEPVIGEVEIVRRDGRAGAEPLPVKEKAVDDSSADSRVSIGWNAYSGSGEVVGEVVYANYGTKEDFEKLRELGVDCRGKIVIARYGGNFRGFKAKFAEEAGAAGLIIYNDPEDVGYVKGLMYPEGGWANETQIQRGSINTLDYPGDPLTPGEPAIEGTKRLDPKDVALPRIPVQPVGWVAAEPIMAAMRGAVVPEAWQGGLDLNYRVEGGEGLRVRLKVEQERKMMRTANVVGVLRGKDNHRSSSYDGQRDHLEGRLREIAEKRTKPGEDPDWLDMLEAQYREQLEDVEGVPYLKPFIVVGCHHDAWVDGAGDPTSGLIVVLEMARAFADMAAKRERPDRTICFAAWAAEEFGLIGSTEWVEQHSKHIAKNCVAYLNLDMAAMGPHFGASASPLLKTLIADASMDGEQCDKPGVSVHDAWDQRDDGHALEQQIGSLGGGSDHVGFYCRLGVPSMGMGAGGSSGVSYHSAYDDLEWYRKVVGDDYAPAAMITKVALVTVARLANADVLPYDVAAFADEFTSDLDELEARARTLGKKIPSTNVLREALAGAKDTGARFRPSINLMFAEEKAPPEMLAETNRQLVRLSRSWLRDEGLPKRAWFRNLLVATDPNTGYGSWSLPELRWFVESEDQPYGSCEWALRDYEVRAAKWADKLEDVRQTCLILIPAQVDRP